MSNGPIYTLGEQIYSADGIVTYRGFVSSTNEAVYIHALPVESVELYDQALKLFRSFSVDRPILHVFAFEGQPYVVTRPRPEQTNFRSWLSAQTAARERVASPPIIFHGGSQHSTPRPLDVLENKTITADPSMGLPRENRNLSTPSTPKEVHPEQVGDFTRMFGPLDDSKHKGGNPVPGTPNKISSPVSMSDPVISKPVRDGQDPLLKTIRSGSSPSGVMRPHDRNGSWGPVETELPAPSKLRSPTPGTRQPEILKSDAGEFTRVFGNKTFDQPSLTPSERPGNAAAPLGDFTRLIRDNNPGERKTSSEPQRPGPEIKREELNASEPGYGLATRVFQSPRKDFGPASPSSPAGEFTRVYGAKHNSDVPLYATEIRPDSKGDGAGEEAEAEQPTPANNPSQSKPRDSNLPLVLVVVFSLLIIVAVIAYLALR